MCVNIQEHNIKVNEAMARDSNLSTRKKREMATVMNKQAQLKILQMNKEIFIKQHGEQTYDMKVNKLLTTLLNAGPEDGPYVLCVNKGANNEDHKAGVGEVIQVEKVNDADVEYN